ncbi:hypothetical protein [Ureibacillus acetophenoni]|uniref:Uncharacterized protein n=1 Tax=Ureibacillus acetophenoni TaxID=614649 RepID=A0A285UBD3_9BACL|nr:hypothetical protein [Ureibacillus acetophenoni]SOC39224.1 hypothetical protein SAMN05877842_105112 [Ureibacillus acetophenoni]
MDRIKKVMDDAYREGKFSDEKKSETLVVIQNRKKTFQPVPVVATLFITILILLISTMIPPTEQVEYVSTERADVNLEEAYMERIHLGFNITTEEQLENYLSESDWLLQRALESGNSVFYHSPQLNQWERKDLATLLHYLYIWRDTYGSKALPFDTTVTTFYDVLREAPFYVKVLSDFFDDEPYMTSMEEIGEIPVTNFGAMSQGNQIGLIITIIFFIILFVWNTKSRVNLLFRLIPIVIILMCLIPFVSPVKNDYAYDETSIMQVAQKQLDLDGGLLENAATFNNARYGLISVNAKRYMVTFIEDEHGYSYSRSVGGSDWVMEDLNMGNGTMEYIFGFFKGHPYSKVKLVGDGGQEVEIHVTPGESVIKKVELTNDSYRYYYYDDKGNEIQ